MQLQNKKNEDLLLMMKDIPVMRINFDEAIFEILDEKHLPYQLKGALVDFTIPENISSSELKKYTLAAVKAGVKNSEAVTSYFAQRTLPITRENAKKIYSLFGFEQAQDDYSKARVAVTCRSVSLQDNYWIKLESDPVKWADVNIRNNKLNEVVAQVALHGSSLTLTGDVITPELSMFGAYAKAWKREDDGLYLYKKGGKTDEEAKIEVMTSDILDCFNVDSLKYIAAKSNNEYCSKCECMTTDEYSIISAMDFESYCNRNGKNFMQEVLKIDAESFYKMCIVDYLIANRDRHGMNWGFVYNCDTMEIVGCHKLFDHNNAFDEDLMKNPKVPYLAASHMTMDKAAELAMRKIDFHQIKEIPDSIFLNNAQKEYFYSKMSELKIKKNLINENEKNVEERDDA